MTNEGLLDSLEAAVVGPDLARVAAARDAVLARMGPPPGWKLVPAGWKAVPIEPTDAMKRASRLTHELEPGNDVSRITMWGCNAWAAMLDAAPTPTTPEGSDHAG